MVEEALDFKDRVIGMEDIFYNDKDFVRRGKFEGTCNSYDSLGCDDQTHGFPLSRSICFREGGCAQGLTLTIHLHMQVKTHKEGGGKTPKDYYS
jgi:hypothetical protein